MASTKDRLELGKLPHVIDVPTAGLILGISTRTAYELVRTGGWPTRLLRVGRKIFVPTAELVRLLGADARG
jgi:predicted site-specific integrase-resolvase